MRLLKIALVAAPLFGCLPPSGPQGPNIDDCCQLEGGVPGAATVAGAAGSVTAYASTASGGLGSIIGGPVDVKDDFTYSIPLKSSADGETDILVVYRVGGTELGRAVVAATAESGTRLYAPPISAESTLESIVWAGARGLVATDEPFHSADSLWSHYLELSISSSMAQIVEESGDPALADILAKSAARDQYALYVRLQALSSADPSFDANFAQLGQQIRDTVALYDRLVHFGKAKADADRLANRDVGLLIRDFAQQYSGTDTAACESVFALQIATLVQILAGDPSLIFAGTQPEGALLLELWREQTKRILFAHGTGWNESYSVLAATPPAPGDFPGFMDSALANIDTQVDPAQFWVSYQTAAVNDTESKLTANTTLDGATGTAYQGAFGFPGGTLLQELDNLGQLPPDSTVDTVRSGVESVIAAIEGDISAFSPESPQVNSSMKCTAAMSLLNAGFWAPRGS